MCRTVEECVCVCASCVPTLVTHIWLVVRVPVLSEQMTEVQPRVSTEGRDLTMAFFLAMRRVPRARQVVMTAGRPGGESRRQRRMGGNDGMVREKRVS